MITHIEVSPYTLSLLDQTKSKNANPKSTSGRCLRSRRTSPDPPVVVDSARGSRDSVSSSSSEAEEEEETNEEEDR